MHQLEYSPQRDHHSVCIKLGLSGKCIDVCDATCDDAGRDAAQHHSSTKLKDGSDLQGRRRRPKAASEQSVVVQIALAAGNRVCR